MDFEKICKVFSMQEPFYGIILSSMDRVPCSPAVCQTMGVGRSGKTFKLVYNPDFVASHTDEALLQILKHEVLHLCLSHPFIGKELGYDRDQQTHNLYNIACDIEVNCYIDLNKVDKERLFTAERLNFPKNLGSREYYNRLLQLMQKQQQQANDPNMPCNGGQGQGTGGNNGNGIPDIAKAIGLGGSDLMDSHSMWPKDMDETDAEILKQAIEELAAFAAEEVQKSRGTIPAEMHGLIDKIKKKPKPVADWRRYCRRFLGNEYTYLTKKSRKRESNRFPDAAGTRHLRKSRILVAIDTSGSVSMPEYREFMGQILTMKEKANFRILECDATIQNEYEFNGIVHTDLHGGGGTDFAPVINYFIKRRNEFDCLVYFTDGYCNIPENTPKDTLWVVSSKGDHDKKKYMVNGCSAVFIPEQSTQEQ